MITRSFSIADFIVVVRLPDGCDVEALLPSFRPFQCERPWKEDEVLVEFTTEAADKSSLQIPIEELTLLEENINDIGLVRLYEAGSKYYITVSSISGHFTHAMLATDDFSVVEASLVWDDPNAGYMLCSLLRIAYSQAVLRRAAVSIHASAVSCDGRAYLFMGKSGTGKSTHAALWLKHISGCELLNDDNPTIRLVGDTVIAYGTPWSGKTSCYKQLSFPVGGMVRLSQAQENLFHFQAGPDAFIALYPGCSVINQNTGLRNQLFDSLVRMAELVQVGTLGCLPNKEAAILCHQKLTEGF